MEKIIYWLRKIGVLRSSSYVAKNAEELNESVATDGGMIQSQEQIDQRYKDASETERTSQKE